jgi:hypothetical protein
VNSLKNKLGIVVVFMAISVITAVIVVAARTNDVGEVSESVFARDTALRFIFYNCPELLGVINPSTIRTPWDVENIDPEEWVGSTTVRFTKFDWTVTVSYPVVLEPIYTVSIESNGRFVFTWLGVVDQDGNVADCDLPLVG